MLYKRFDFNNTPFHLIIWGATVVFACVVFQTLCILWRLFKQLALFQNYGSDLFKKNDGSEKISYLIELASSFQLLWINFVTHVGRELHNFI